MPRAAQTTPVLLDTGVFRAGLIASEKNRALAELYRPHVQDRLIVLAPQTVGELYFQALRDGWGIRSMQALQKAIDDAHVLPMGGQVLRTYGELRFRCQQMGHALAGRAHANDLWIASATVHYGLPLVAHDGIFRDVPGLELITELAG